jgi:DNA modification methylase
VWWDIQRTRTLNSNLVRREQDDEKHICPLQMDIVERVIARFSNPDDVVLDYFAGLGTVPVIALDMGRRGVGIELKQSYYEVAARYLREREIAQGQLTMFAEVER